MQTPTNWDEELKNLRNSIADRLNVAAQTIVHEEIAKILGRVKIFTSASLENGQYHWFIEHNKEKN